MRDTAAENELAPTTPTPLPVARRVIVLAPHPDDEVFGCGGALHLLARAGAAITVIVATDGALGGGPHDRETVRLVEAREAECAAAAAVLGYPPPLFWRMPDRGLRYGEALVERVLGAMRDVDPDLVFVSALTELHPDHQALALASAEALRRLGGERRLLCYEVSAPVPANMLIDITSAEDAKLAAMRCFTSQLAQQPYDRRIAALNRYRTYTLPEAVTAAEAYFAATASDLSQGLGRLFESIVARRRRVGAAIDSAEVPLVTVIVRSMDRPVLHEALASLAAQTYPNVEAVVVNATGRAHTPLPAFGGTLVLRLLETGEPLPRSRAANVGLEAARGEYLAFLDDDDTLDPDHIARLVRTLIAEGPGTVAYSGVRGMARGDPERRIVHVFGEPFESTAKLLAGNFIPSHAPLFPRRPVEEGVRFDEGLDIYEDWDFWLQLAQRLRFVYVDHVSATYYTGGTSEASPLAADPELTHRAAKRIFAKWHGRMSAEELKALSDLYHRARADLAHYRSVVADRGRHIENLERNLRMREEAAAATADHVRNLEEALALANDHVRNLESAARQWERDVGMLQAELRLIYASPSWRLTAPLRKAKQAALWLLHLWRRRTHAMRLEPERDVVAEGAQYRSSGPRPQFALHSARGRLPTGWVIVSCTVSGGADRSVMTLYWNSGRGFNDRESARLPIGARGDIRALVRLPARVDGLRLECAEGVDPFALEDFCFREVGKLQLAGRLLRRYAQAARRDPRRASALVRQNLSAIRTQGFAALHGKLLRSVEDVGPLRQRTAGYGGALSAAQRERMQERIARMRLKPLISVIVPVYDTPEPWLRHAIDSVLKQVYPHWELCIADDASPSPVVKRVLEEYRARDSRIKVAYREQQGHICAASNSALALATGDFVALLDHDDELAEDALYRVAEELNAHPEAALVYSDEDKIDENGRHFDPHFKSDWNPDLFYAQNYVCHLSVYAAELVRRIGGFRPGYEGSQDYDLWLRASRAVRPGQIRHIPRILYHWRAIAGSTALRPGEKDYAENAAIAALRDHFAQAGAPVAVERGPLPTTYRVRYPVPQPSPLVTLVIPTRDSRELLERCVSSIRELTTYRRYEIVIVDNQSADPATLAYLSQLASSGAARVLRYDHPFNYSAINNFAVAQTQGDIVGLVNNDIEVITPEWLEEMVSHAARADIGAVGAKLLYGNGLIQHAGVILGIGGVAGHSHKLLSGSAPGYFGRAQLVQNVSAVTGACLLVRREVYEQVGGLDERELKIAFNDVDFCLRVREAGYRNLWTPYAVLYHHESLTRGYEDTPEKVQRFNSEMTVMKARWGRLLERDPYYNPNLTLSSEDFSPA